MQLSLNCQEFYPVMAPISPKKTSLSLQLKETDLNKVNTEDNVTVCSSNADTLSQVDSSEQDYSLEKLMSSYDDFKFV